MWASLKGQSGVLVYDSADKLRLVWPTAHPKPDCLVLWEMRYQNPMKKKRTSKFKVDKLSRHDDLPASVGLVKEVRSELLAAIHSTHQELDGKITQLDGRITQLDGRVTGVEGKISEVLAVVHRTQALMEEQRSENRIVLDGLKSVMERQDRMEARMNGLQ